MVVTVRRISQELLHIVGDVDHIVSSVCIINGKVIHATLIVITVEVIILSECEKEIIMR